MSEDMINIFESKMVPKHEILTEEQKVELLKKMNIELKYLPRIKDNDPAVKLIGAKKFDVIKISRTPGYSYYRVVVPAKRA